MMKTTTLAVLVALALSACGGGDVRQKAAGSDPPASSSEGAADLWAQNAFGMYGHNAVATCLFAFQSEFRAANGDVMNYRADLANYLCACARGTSPHPCPEP